MVLPIFTLAGPTAIKYFLAALTFHELGEAKAALSTCFVLGLRTPHPAAASVKRLCWFVGIRPREAVEWEPFG